MAHVLPKTTQGPTLAFLALWHCMALVHFRGRTLSFFLFDIMKFLLVHHSSLSMSLGTVYVPWVATLPSTVVSALLNVACSTKVIKITLLKAVKRGRLPDRPLQNPTS